MAEFPPLQLLPYQAVSPARVVRVLMEGFEPKGTIHTELTLIKGVSQSWTAVLETAVMLHYTEIQVI
jgi:hypothetical protein